MLFVDLVKFIPAFGSSTHATVLYAHFLFQIEAALPTLARPIMSLDANEDAIVGALKQSLVISSFKGFVHCECFIKLYLCIICCLF